MRAGLPIVRSCWRLLAVGIVFGTPALCLAQDQLGTIQGLQDAYQNTRKRREGLLDGTAKPGKGDMEVAKATAENLLWRFTHDTELADAKRIKALHTEVNAVVTSALNGKGNRPFIDDYFLPALVASLEELFNRKVTGDNRPTVVHAASTLPTLAKLTSKERSDKLGDYLVKLVQDPKTHDVVRLYALKALKEAMPITEQPEEKLRLDLKLPAQNNQRSRDAKYVDALTAYLDLPFDAATLTDEEQYVAKRYIRHHAIVALAEAKAPAVMAYAESVAKQKEPMGPVAPALLKVLTETAPANVKANIRMLILKDKVEAAIGLCHMSYKNMPEYDPAAANYLIGEAVLEFVNEYKKDRVYFKADGADKRLPHHSWKIDAMRLEVGLTKFAENAKTKGAGELGRDALPILAAVTKYLEPNPGKLGDLERKVAELRPKGPAAKVFKTLPKAPLITLPAAN